jgi:Fe-S-cluster containining protein
MEDNEEQGDDPEATPDGETPSEDPPRFIYECVRCGHSCADRNFVEVTLEDLRAWTEDQTLAYLFPHLRLVPIGRPYLDIVLASDEGLRAFEEGDAEHRGCPVYDAENKLCNIYHSMPLYCRSFPLASNGRGYFIKDRECQGLGQGEMTAERLRAHREAAVAEFESRRETGMLMPTLQGLFTRFFVETSARTLDAMSPEDRSRLEELLAKQIEMGPEEQEQGDEGS